MGEVPCGGTAGKGVGRAVSSRVCLASAGSIWLLSNPHWAAPHQPGQALLLLHRPAIRPCALTLYSFLASSWKKSWARAEMRASSSSRHRAILAMWPFTCGRQEESKGSAKGEDGGTWQTAHGLSTTAGQAGLIRSARTMASIPGACMLLIRPAPPPPTATAQRAFIMSFRMRWVSTISVFLRTAASLRSASGSYICSGGRAGRGQGRGGQSCTAGEISSEQRENLPKG